MPKLPTYELQVRGGGGPYSSPDFINLSTPYAQAVSDIGSVLTQRSVQMLQEYDAAKAYEAYNSYSDSVRGKTQELMGRESGAAFGVQKDFEEYERTTRSKVETSVLTAPSQQVLFSRLADSHRTHTLNSLASHEAQQTRLYKVEQLKGIADTVDRNMRPLAFDEVSARLEMDKYVEANGRMFPGHDRSADIAAAREVFRFSQGNEIVSKNPKYAEQWLEIPEVKRELGDKYDVLKTALQSQVAEDVKSVAYTEAVSKFGANYAAIEHYFEQPAQVNRLGYKTSMELANQAASIRSRRQTEEDRGITIHKHNQEQSFDRMMSNWYALTPGQPPPDFLGALQRGEISSTQYEHWKNGKQSASADDMATYDRYNSRVARGESTTELKNAIIAEPLLSETSKRSMINAIADDGIKKGYADISHVTGAGMMNPSEDQKLKGYEMSKKYEMRLLRGEDPRKARDEVIREYTIDLKRTKQTLPQTTPHLDQVGGKRDDDYALEQAMRAAASTYARKSAEAEAAGDTMAADQALREYENEVEDLKRLLGNARSFKLVGEAEETKRQDDAKKKDKEGGSVKRPGASY